MIQMRIHVFNENLNLIELNPGIPGFERFIGAWVYKEGRNCFIVDVGPSKTVKDLLTGLRKLKISRIEFILLTHIHIDHAGGIGNLLNFFPETRVFCHEKAVKHLLDPSRLWKGSKKVLGELAIKYGEITSVPEENISSREEPIFEGEKISVVKTPGHAPHQLSYLYKGYLFAGEAAGVYISLNRDFYMRPATPPKFHLETALESIDKLITLKPMKICYGHFGMHSDALKMLKIHREQLILWGKVIGENLIGENDEIVERSIKSLIQRDELFQRINLLDAEIRIREKYFSENSIKGYIDYLKQNLRCSLP